MRVRVNWKKLWCERIIVQMAVIGEILTEKDRPDLYLEEKEEDQPLAGIPYTTLALLGAVVYFEEDGIADLIKEEPYIFEPSVEENYPLLKELFCGHYKLANIPVSFAKLLAGRVLEPGLHFGSLPCSMCCEQDDHILVAESDNSNQMPWGKVLTFEEMGEYTSTGIRIIHGGMVDWDSGFRSPT